MTNAFQHGPKKLSPRGARAVALLKDGAQFVKRLERDGYTGREQWKTRLVKNGQHVKGYGVSTFAEISQMLAPASRGTSVSSYYMLAGV